MVRKVQQQEDVAVLTLEAELTRGELALEQGGAFIESETQVDSEVLKVKFLQPRGMVSDDRRWLATSYKNYTVLNLSLEVDSGHTEGLNTLRSHL